jgi:uncharacterized protein
MKWNKALADTERDAFESNLVESYLRKHPEFFQERLELLETMQVPHPSGEAVSLVARQLQLLRERNGKLQQQLNDILHIARDNDALSRRLHQLTLALLDAVSIDDALGGLRWSLHECFQADFVTVRLLEPVCETAIADLFVDRTDPAATYVASLLEGGTPECGFPAPDQAALLFGNDAHLIMSYALIPLSHAGLKGVLAIGSCDPSRFEAGMGHLFLTQMGEIVAARFVTLLTGYF